MAESQVSTISKSPDKPKVKFDEVKHQYFAAISANIIMLGFGCGIGWLSPALPLLQSEATPLASGPLTVEQTSWAGSIPSIGAIIANFGCGYLVTKIGAKKSILYLGIPQLSAWLLLIFGTDAMNIYAARLLNGVVGGGVQICISLYIAEIADNRIRGQLGTIYHFSRNFGILFACTLGAYFDYVISSMVFIGITVLFYASFMFLPSTPLHLLQVEKVKKAEKAFEFYKNYAHRKESQTYIKGFEHLRNIAREVKDDASLTLKDLCEPTARKGLFIALIFPLINQLSGAYIFLTYGSNVIEKSGSSLSPKSATILLALGQLMGTFLTSQLVDTKGRKFLLVLSLSGCTLGLSSMTSYLFLDSHGYDMEMIRWLPVVLMSFIVFIASAGIVPLTLICLVEVFPIKVRSFGVTMGNLALNLYSFIIIKSFPVLGEIIQLHGCLFICAVSCFIGILFMIFFVDETKGKDLNVVQKENATTSAA